MKDISRILKAVYRARSTTSFPAAALSAWRLSPANSPPAKGDGDPQRLVQLPLDADFRDGQDPGAGNRAESTQDWRRATVAVGASPVSEVVAAIASSRPDVVFAPHVETAAGMILPDDYLRAVADAVHAVGGLFVLDCIASGAMWVDMQATGVDVLVSAPQRAGAARPAVRW